MGNQPESMIDPNGLKYEVFMEAVLTAPDLPIESTDALDRAGHMSRMKIEDIDEINDFFNTSLLLVSNGDTENLISSYYSEQQQAAITSSIVESVTMSFAPTGTGAVMRSDVGEEGNGAMNVVEEWFNSIGRNINSGELLAFNGNDISLLSGGDRNLDKPVGTMTLSQANKWYYIGNGEGVYMDFTKIILPKTVTVERFAKPDFWKDGYPGIYVYFDSPKDFVNPNQGLVYGTIGIVLIDKNTVWALPDIYDFDQKNKEGTFFRDLATAFGSLINNFFWMNYHKPKKFPIYFQGYQQIPTR